MKAKEVITAMVPWATSRTYFYWRMRRRLLECQLIKDILAADAGLAGDWQKARAQLESVIDKSVLGNDKAYATWMEKNTEKVTSALAGIAESALVGEITGKIGGLSAAAKASLLKLLAGK
jgi:acetyl-CoA carboxylase/biotin carboxylase 1